MMNLYFVQINFKIRLIFISLFMLFNYYNPTIKSIYYPKFKLSMLITNLNYQLYKFLCNQCII